MAFDEPDAVKRIDSALRRLYKLKGFDKYDNDDGVGLFSAFCEENGFEDDGETLEEEFDAGAAECTFCDMTDEMNGHAFPWIPEDSEDRNKQIFTILSKCWKENEAYSNAGDSVEPLKISQEDWKISEKDLKRAQDMMKQQCPDMCDGHFLHDQVLITVIAVGIKLQKPYLQWLADMYAREQLYRKCSGAKDSKYMVPEWALKNKHLKQLAGIKAKFQSNNKSMNPKEMASAAVNSYSKRIAPSLMLNPPMAIQDSLRVVSQYIAATVDMVHNLVSAQKHSCPFQYDSVYAFGKVKPLAAFSLMDDQNDGSDDDDSDQGDDEKLFDDGDPFGSIVDKLKANALPFTKIQSKVGTARFIDGFKTFREEHMTEQKDYPRNERFLSVIDRRKDDEMVLFYAPPNNCRTLPNPVSPFRFFENARVCVVPDKEYTNRLKDKVDLTKQKSLETVSTLSLKKGIVLSFHCLSVDEIRCYIYINSQGMRFMPEDICHLLPIFFDPEFAGNKNWATSKEAKNLVKEMDKKLRDDGFKAFFNSFKHQKTPEI